MKQTEIQEKRFELNAKRRALQKEEDRLALDFKYLRLECEHPDKFNTCHMGEDCCDCPDCGACGLPRVRS